MRYYTRTEIERFFWNDESRFENPGSNCYYIQRRSGERYNNTSLQPSLRNREGPVMVWGSVSACCVGDPVKIGKMMNK